MKKEKRELGDIRINKDTSKSEICTEVVYGRDGIVVTWEDYGTKLLESTWGQCCHSDEVYPLSRFRDAFMTAKIGKPKPKNQIKIRYAYMGSPSTMRIDRNYHETLRFKVLTLEQLETRSIKTTLEELITDGKEAVIKILGRDRCTELKDMTGEEIFENDIVRWFPRRSTGYKDVLVKYQRHMYVLGDWEDNWLPGTEVHCKVIGTIYDSTPTMIGYVQL